MHHTVFYSSNAITIHDKHDITISYLKIQALYFFIKNSFLLNYKLVHVEKVASKYSGHDYNSKKIKSKLSSILFYKAHMYDKEMNSHIYFSEDRNSMKITSVDGLCDIELFARGHLCRIRYPVIVDHEEISERYVLNSTVNLVRTFWAPVILLSLSIYNNVNSTKHNEKLLQQFNESVSMSHSYKDTIEIHIPKETFTEEINSWNHDDARGFMRGVKSAVQDFQKTQLFHLTDFPMLLKNLGSPEIILFNNWSVFNDRDKIVAFNSKEMAVVHNEFQNFDFWYIDRLKNEDSPETMFVSDLVPYEVIDELPLRDLIHYLLRLVRFESKDETRIEKREDINVKDLDPKYEIQKFFRNDEKKLICESKIPDVGIFSLFSENQVKVEFDDGTLIFINTNTLLQDESKNSIRILHIGSDEILTLAAKNIKSCDSSLQLKLNHCLDFIDFALGGSSV
ncbi:hypothetical protein ROZALSC1DRAFT_31122 [Rozella allomycis CSF55]|uniref:Uncharacterized protein n=1 Tax=Rozella allomycis (strain CSF55) TaxID=988480 RepID=A0A075AMM5_ROZAC|nr:hypothetical protein O9G_005045 [Rozella allomycis CSF55]RKP17031.1 hypothetical protein ROZALSC1DRAFT_31122 [Rozella allomycis CSF55]|eukprot:EPZ30878.1 hypothetical protein O9G_005045 [Rozella allomycis CSF55]